MSLVMVSTLRSSSSSNSGIIKQGHLKNIRLIDLCFLFYLCTMFANRTGEGLDPFLFRVSFVLYVLIAIITVVLPKAKSSEAHFFNSFTVWFSVFWLFAYSSYFWAWSQQYVLYDTYTNMVSQLVFLVFFIAYDIEDKNTLIKYLGIFVIAVLYCALLLFIKTPIGAWGTERVGETIGVNYNVLGMRMAVAAYFALYIGSETKRPYWYAAIAPFAVIAVYSGSRKAFLMLIVMCALYMVLSKKGGKAFRNAMIAVALVAIAVTVIYSNDTLYYILGRRLDGMIASFTGMGAVDYSSNERAFMREYAMRMWSERPIFGWGFNAFQAMMDFINYRNVAYSHNNFTELLCDLGIAGLLLYYSFYCYLGFRILKLRAKKGILLLFCGILLMVITVFGYGQVAFMGPDEWLYLAFIFAGVRVVSKKNRIGAIREHK